MKNKKIAKNTKGKTFQEVHENNKENTDNISNLGYDDIRMQGTISSAIANVDQNYFLLKKKDNQKNQIGPGNWKTQETGEVNKVHKKHDLNSDAASDIHSQNIANDRKMNVNGDSNLTENKTMGGGGASGVVNIEGNENLCYKEVVENKENTRKNAFESCDTKG